MGGTILWHFFLFRSGLFARGKTHDATKTTTGRRNSTLPPPSFPLFFFFPVGAKPTINCKMEEEEKETSRSSLLSTICGEGGGGGAGKMLVSSFFATWETGEGKTRREQGNEERERVWKRRRNSFGGGRRRPNAHTVVSHISPQRRKGKNIRGGGGGQWGSPKTTSENVEQTLIFPQKSKHKKLANSLFWGAGGRFFSSFWEYGPKRGGGGLERRRLTWVENLPPFSLRKEPRRKSSTLISSNFSDPPNYQKLTTLRSAKKKEDGQSC